MLTRDVVCDQGQEAFGGAGERELFPLDAGRVRPALPARDQGTARLHALRLQEGRGTQELWRDPKDRVIIFCLMINGEAKETEAEESQEDR